jgi:DNA-binding CsgD family transcriptional regulator
VQLDLSEEEKRILEMIVGNMSVSEIAFALDV